MRNPRWPATLVTVCGCAAVVAVSLGCGGLFTTPTPGDGPPAGWTDSTLAVQAGDQVSFFAAGTIDMWPNCQDTKAQEGYPDLDCDVVQHVGPSGTNVFPPALSDYPMPGVDVMTLVGRVGDGPPFVVGAQATLTMQQSGELKLAANDPDWRRADDHGWFLVKVRAPKGTVLVAVR
jgi:hypothetical protein